MESSSSKTAKKNSPVSVFRHMRFEHLYAGISGGVVSTIVLHPLDLVKIRFQGECVTKRSVYRFDFDLKR